MIRKYSFLLLALASLVMAKQAPLFEGLDLDGNKWLLKDNLGKSYVLIDFWSTTCEPCKDEHPHLQALKEKYKDKLIIVAVSLDPASKTSNVKSYIVGNRYDFKVLLDPSREIARLFQVNDIPQVFFMNPKGEILYSHRGYSPGDEVELKKQVDELIEKDKPVEKKDTSKKKFHQFTSTDLTGKPFSLEEELKKGAIIIDFWSTTCSPCKDEHNILQDLLNKYSKDGLQVVAVSLDPSSKKSKIMPYLTSNRFGFIPIHDEDSTIKQLYQVKDMPVTVVISKEGDIIYQHTGYQPGDEDELEKWVKQALGK